MRQHADQSLIGGQFFSLQICHFCFFDLGDIMNDPMYYKCFIIRLALWGERKKAFPCFIIIIYDLYFIVFYIAFFIQGFQLSIYMMLRNKFLKITTDQFIFLIT